VCGRNRTHGSTGGDWKRNATASSRQPPTQPTSGPLDVISLAKRTANETLYDATSWRTFVSNWAAIISQIDAYTLANSTKTARR
jgi:hypothetical protein